MNPSSVLKKVASIMNDTSLSAGKKSSEIGNIIKQESKLLEVTPNTKAAMINIGKWGGVAAATGIGAGIGVGGGSMIASAGVKEALGIDPSNPEETVKTVGGWVLLLVIIAVIIYLLLPQIKKVMK